METRIEQILQKHRWIELSILKLQQELNDLHLKAECIGSFDYSKPKVNSSPSADASYTKTVELIVYKQQKLSNKLLKLLQEREAIEHLIEQIPDESQVCVLYQHYVLCKTYEHIAESMDYSVENIYVLRKKGIAWLDEHVLVVDSH